MRKQHLHNHLLLQLLFNASSRNKKKKNPPIGKPNLHSGFVCSSSWGNATKVAATISTTNYKLDFLMGIKFQAQLRHESRPDPEAGTSGIILTSSEPETNQNIGEYVPQPDTHKVSYTTSTQTLCLKQPPSIRNFQYEQ